MIEYWGHNLSVKWRQLKCWAHFHNGYFEGGVYHCRFCAYTEEINITKNPRK